MKYGKAFVRSNKDMTTRDQFRGTLGNGDYIIPFFRGHRTFFLKYRSILMFSRLWQPRKPDCIFTSSILSRDFLFEFLFMAALAAGLSSGNGKKIECSDEACVIRMTFIFFEARAPNTSMRPALLPCRALQVINAIFSIEEIPLSEFFFSETFR